jgi:hypothetical protein
MKYNHLWEERELGKQGRRRKIHMQNRDGFYMQILGSKRGVEFWEEKHPWYALGKPWFVFFLC